MSNELAMARYRNDALPAPGVADARAGSTAVGVGDGHRRYLFHPVIDFLCLGGGSLIVLSLMILLLPTEAAKPQVKAICFALAMVINHPHFAHSYQIFYRGFREKVFGDAYGPMLRARYVLAGIGVPAALLIFFAIGLSGRDGLFLGYGVNAMLFLVGWHYVKQGYGMFIVDSVLKRKFFADWEKHLLVLNAYSCWAYAWIHTNAAVHENDYFGLKYYSFDLPDPVQQAASGVLAVTTTTVLVILLRRMLGRGPGVPFNGLVAYTAALYFWLSVVRINPLFVLTIPVFHSLQYLVVVWRYQLNIERDRQHELGQPAATGIAGLIPSSAIIRFAIFVLIGTMLGFVGFLGAPILLKHLIPYDLTVFGGSLFLFLFWIFINIHHYFIDNVIWRRENPEVSKYLFSRP